MVPALAQLGAYFSFPGYFAHERKAKQREAFQVVPADRLLIETDAPFLAPVPLRGQPNEPANVRYVAEYLAELKEIELADLAFHTTRNFYQLFHPQALL